MASIFTKLQYKDQKNFLLLNAPEEFRPFIEEVAGKLRISEQPDDGEGYDFILAFVRQGSDIETLAALVARLVSVDGLVWFAYPKKSSKKYHSDIDRDHGWKPVFDQGYQPVRQIAIDEDWSALRFRPAEQIRRK